MKELGKSLVSFEKLILETWVGHDYGKIQKTARIFLVSASGITALETIRSCIPQPWVTSSYQIFPALQGEVCLLTVM